MRVCSMKRTKEEGGFDARARARTSFHLPRGILALLFSASVLLPCPLPVKIKNSDRFFPEFPLKNPIGATRSLVISINHVEVCGNLQTR